MKKWFEDNRICLWCEETFKVKGRSKRTAKSKPKVFCSDGCRYLWHNENSPNERRRTRREEITGGKIT